MTELRKQEIAREMESRWSRLQGRSAAEERLIRLLNEFLADKSPEEKTPESEYKRGYEDGVHDEADRQYEARMAAKQPKKAEEKPPEPEELPFGEVE